MTNRIILGIIAAAIVVGGLEAFREPIYTISFETTLRFDIVSVFTAYVMGFVSAVLGFGRKKEESNEQ
jgi:ABC-type uncharacterized transport system permease subunit